MPNLAYGSLEARCGRIHEFNAAADIIEWYSIT